MMQDQRQEGQHQCQDGQYLGGQQAALLWCLTLYLQGKALYGKEQLMQPLQWQVAQDPQVLALQGQVLQAQAMQVLNWEEHVQQHCALLSVVINNLLQVVMHSFHALLQLQRSSSKRSIPST